MIPVHGTTARLNGTMNDVLLKVARRSEDVAYFHYSASRYLIFGSEAKINQIPSILFVSIRTLERLLLIGFVV